MTLFFLASLLAGAASGIAAGLFGLGGGVVIVPILVEILPWQAIPKELVMIMAVATSLASIILTSLSSIWAHHLRGYVLWTKVRYLSLGIVLGVIFGAFTAEHISAEHLRLLFAVFLFYSATQIFLQVVPESSESAEKNPMLDYIVGIGIGIVASISGTGGGSLTVPYLVSRRVKIKNAVAISSACSFPIAVAASMSYAVLGLKHSAMPEWSFGYIYLPAFLGVALSSVFTAPVGAKLAHVLPAEKLKRYFALVLFILSVKMLSH